MFLCILAFKVLLSVIVFFFYSFVIVLESVCQFLSVCVDISGSCSVFVSVNVQFVCVCMCFCVMVFSVVVVFQSPDTDNLLGPSKDDRALPITG